MSLFCSILFFKYLSSNLFISCILLMNTIHYFLYHFLSYFFHLPVLCVSQPCKLCTPDRSSCECPGCCLREIPPLHLQTHTGGTRASHRGTGNQTQIVEWVERTKFSQSHVMKGLHLCPYSWLRNVSAT